LLIISHAIVETLVNSANPLELQRNSKLTYREDKQMGYEVVVDKEKCEGCEECVEVCPVDVFEMEDGKSVPVNAEECLGCESCVEVCDEEAITVTEV
jgi:NAD-dependent dihydropyrimidine dehydrogenase PreA subunit